MQEKVGRLDPAGGVVWGGNAEHSVGPVDPKRVVLFDAKASRDLCDEPGREAEGGRGDEVNACLRMELACAGDFDGIEEWRADRGAGQQACHGDGVTADIKNSTAGHCV